MDEALGIVAVLALLALAGVLVLLRRVRRRHDELAEENRRWRALAIWSRCLAIASSYFFAWPTFPGTEARASSAS